MGADPIRNVNHKNLIKLTLYLCVYLREKQFSMQWFNLFKMMPKIHFCKQFSFICITCCLHLKPLLNWNIIFIHKLLVKKSILDPNFWNANKKQTLYLSELNAHKILVFYLYAEKAKILSNIFSQFSKSTRIINNPKNDYEIN